MDLETVEYKTRDKVGYIIMNRPEKRNALNYQLLDDLDAAFDIAEADDSVNVVVLKGNGPSFCSGYDLSGSYYTSIPKGHDHWDMKNALMTLRAHRRPLPAHLELPQADDSAGARPLPRRRLLPPDALRHQRRRRERAVRPSGAALGRRQQHAPLADTDGREARPLHAA